MSKKLPVLKLIALLCLSPLFLYFILPYLYQQQNYLIYSPSKYADSITLIVTNPTRLRELVIRVDIEDSCDSGQKILSASCRSGDIYGSIAIYASIYGDVPGIVNLQEKRELGIYVYTESDELSRLFSGSCSNLEEVTSGGQRYDILRGTSREGGSGRVYGIASGYSSVLAVDGVHYEDFGGRGCLDSGGLFSVSGEYIEALFPHIGYEFKNRPDFDVRTELITHAMTSAGVLNRLQTGCSLHNDFLRTEYALPSMEEENSGVIISSQICSNLSQRYRVDRAYADSVEDDSYLFDRGFPYINSHIIRLDGVDGYKGDVKPVYVRFHDELYRNHETMALFWAALLGSFIISLSFDCLIWLSSRLAACFVAIHELWLDCGATFYEHVKNKKF